MNITDYDMVRIRVLNEVELTHQDELEQKNQEIKKIEILLNENKRKNVFYEDKIRALEEKVKQIEHEIQINAEEYSRRSTK